MEPIQSKIEELEDKVNKLQRTVDKIKKIFIWTVIVSIALFILPLIGLLIIIPQFLSIYANLGQ
jgi:type II secretory pathway component PulF